MVSRRVGDCQSYGVPAVDHKHERIGRFSTSKSRRRSMTLLEEKRNSVLANQEQK